MSKSSSPASLRTPILLIGGLDPSGGAGLTLDAAVARGLGLHPLPVLTTLAIQNTSGVVSRADVSANDLQQQLATLKTEYALGGVKIGLLPTAEHIEVVLGWLKQNQPPAVVLDPVMASGSGNTLVDPDQRSALKDLLSWVTILTPNVPEAMALAPVASVHADNTFEVMHALQAQGPRGVYLKGGHLTASPGNDFFLFDDESCCLLPTQVHSRNIRGTGCALATHLACSLALGASPLDAAARAKEFMNRELSKAYASGQGLYLQISGAAPKHD